MPSTQHPSAAAEQDARLRCTICGLAAPAATMRPAADASEPDADPDALVCPACAPEWAAPTAEQTRRPHRRTRPRTPEQEAALRRREEQPICPACAQPRGTHRPDCPRWLAWRASDAAR